MDAPLRPLPTELAWRIERAEAEQLARTGPPGRAAAREIAGGLAVFKGPRSPFSACIGAGLQGPADEADVDGIEAHLAGGPVRVEVTALAHASLAAELARRRYRLERQLLVWHRPLADADADADPDLAPPVAGLSVRPIRDGEEERFVEVFAVAFFGRAAGSAAETAALLSMTSARGNVCFGAFDGRALVGVGVLSVHEGVATLTGAGVLPEHRGHGVQRALIRARLAWAAARGTSDAAAVTHPATASQRNLEQTGFRCAYPKAVLIGGPR